MSPLRKDLTWLITVDHNGATIWPLLLCNIIYYSVFQFVWEKWTRLWSSELQSHVMIILTVLLVSDQTDWTPSFCSYLLNLSLSVLLSPVFPLSSMSFPFSLSLTPSLFTGSEGWKVRKSKPKQRSAKPSAEPRASPFQTDSDRLNLGNNHLRC